MVCHLTSSVWVIGHHAYSKWSISLQLTVCVWWSWYLHVMNCDLSTFQNSFGQYHCVFHCVFKEECHWQWNVCKQCFWGLSLTTRTILVIIIWNILSLLSSPENSKLWLVLSCFFVHLYEFISAMCLQSYEKIICQIFQICNFLNVV